MIINPSVRDQLRRHKINLDNNVLLETPCVFNDHCLVYSQCIVSGINMDSYSYISTASKVSTTEIGRYCSIANNVHMGLQHHEYNRVTTSAMVYRSNIGQFPDVLSESGESFDELISEWSQNAIQNFPILSVITGKRFVTPKIVVGHDVWIGANVMIPKSVTIGTGAVIGAGTIVTRDIPPYAIVSGDVGHKSNIPFTKFRFDEKTVEKLLESKWWEYDIPRLIALGYNIDIANIDDFIQKINDFDPNEVPRIKNNYRVINPISEDKLQIINVLPEFKAWRDI